MKKLMYLLVAGSLSVFTACSPDKPANINGGAGNTNDTTKVDPKDAADKGTTTGTVDTTATKD